LAKKKLTAKDWCTKITRAQNVRDKWRKTFRVGLAYEYFEGKQRPPHIPSDEWITINMILSVLKSELPTLYNADPYFYVKLKQARSLNPMDIALMEAKGRVRQSFLNYLKGELNLKKKARLSIFDAHFQYGICKVHYHADMVENPDAGKPMYHDGTEIPMMDDNGMELMEPDQLPANECYKVSRVHPDDFLVDDDAGPLDDDVSWKAQRMKMPLEDVKADKKYRAAFRKAINAVELSDEAQKERDQRKKGGLATNSKDEVAPDVAVLWEIYDLKNKQWLTIGEGCNEYAIEPQELPPGTEQDCFVDLRFMSRDDSWYPIPPVSQWLDPQREYCESRSKRATHRKRFNRKYVLYGPAFDDPELAASKIENGDDGTVVISNQPGNQAIYPISDAPLDQGEVIEYGYLRQDFQDLAIGANQRGSGAGVDSATEAGILEKRAVIQEGDKIGLVMDFLTTIGRKLDQLVQAHMTQDQAVKVAGPQGEVWELIRQEDYDEIAGEYSYSIDVGQQTPQLPEIERAQLLAALGVFANAPQLLLSRNLTKKVFELHHIYDETIIDELQKISQQMMSGQIPMPGQQGSQPNVTQQNPQAIGGGMAAGINNIRGGQQ
jgi:hypothetical protein